MRSIVLYLHMHQPYRLKHYSIFSVSHDDELHTHIYTHQNGFTKRLAIPLFVNVLDSDGLVAQFQAFFYALFPLFFRKYTSFSPIRPEFGNIL